MIMAGGVLEDKQVKQYADIGANSIGLCTATIRNPLTSPQKVARLLKKYN